MVTGGLNMLIGPTFTLAALEEKMKDKLYEIKMEKSKKIKNFQALQVELNQTDKMIRDEDDQRIANPKYVELFNEFQNAQSELADAENIQRFIEEKLEELESVEERSKGRGNINKETYKVTLTLNDCLKLGIETKDLLPE